MASYKQIFMNYLDREGVRYEDRDEFVVKVTYGGKNLSSIPIYVFFDEDGDPIAELKCWDIANFKDKEAKGIIACNEVNAQYRWIRFYLDKDSDIVSDVDTYFDADTCGQVCFNLLQRITNITDKAYPTFAKALWA